MVLVSNVHNLASAQWHKTETFSAVRNSSLQTEEVEHHRGEKKRTKWQGRSYFLGFLREQMQAISFSVKHETRRLLTPFCSFFISLAHANLLVSHHVGFAWVVESCHSSSGYGVTKPSSVISAKSLAAQRRTVAECDWPPDASFGRCSDRQLETCIEILREREGMSGVGEKLNFHRCDFGVGSNPESLGAYIKPKLVLWISQKKDFLVRKSVCGACILSRKTNRKNIHTLLLWFGHKRPKWNASHFQHIIKAIINWVSRFSPRPHVVVITLTCRQWQAKWFSLPAEWTPPL